MQAAAPQAAPPQRRRRWAAAQAWLLEAKPLLVARDDADYVARANLLLARAAAEQGDTARALSLQRDAMHTPLEVGEWAEAIESLAAYQSAAADEGGRTKTLGNAIEVCAAAATAYPNSAPDVLAAPRMQRALRVPLPKRFQKRRRCPTTKNCAKLILNEIRKRCSSCLETIQL